MGTRGGFFLALEKRECDFGLGLRMNHRPDETGGYGGAAAGFGGPWNSINYAVGGGAMAVPRSRLDPSSPFPFNVSGGGESSGYAFTVAQREELYRQSAIYKYMVASVPVPPELLVPFTKPNTPKSISGKVGRGSVELGFWSNKDPEPWRCRRTDGKKWRCNRDAAPEQRYCERHTHKSRNTRSRKPVEVKTSKPYQKPCSVLVNQSRRESEDQLCSLPNSSDQSRCLDWFINGETIPVQQHDFGLGIGHDHDQQHTRLFIDAWSSAERDGDMNQNHHKSSVSSNQKLPFSCLTLSTSGGDCNEESSGDLKPSWMSPVSWMNSPPGGPLAEALCLGIASSSPRGCSSGGAGKSSGGDGGQGLNFIS